LRPSEQNGSFFVHRYNIHTPKNIKSPRQIFFNENSLLAPQREKYCQNQAIKTACSRKIKGRKKMKVKGQTGLRTGGNSEANIKHLRVQL